MPLGPGAYSQHKAAADVQPLLTTTTTATTATATSSSGRPTINIGNPNNAVGAYNAAAPQRAATAKAKAANKLKALASTALSYPVRKIVDAANAVDAAGVRWLSDGKVAVSQAADQSSDDIWVDLNNADTEQTLLACCEDEMPEAENGSDADLLYEGEMVQAPLISVANRDPKLRMNPARAGRVDW